MHITNIYEAKTHLSRLIEQVLNGEEVVIGKAGKPIVRLIPYSIEQKLRQPGYWRGQVHIAKDFDALPKSISDAFKGTSK